ncbi:Hypothetical Protein SLY_0611 [Strawberry lethal yellows phytoplasma (CPA) str. NZSb11]|uniref:Uncharacterized protein n=1 Tax=Strawberry lethal yellows phytoplasma (CPA) str. NZSb11 TaxID=980422 RepID=R4RPX3_PHYAS|nr:Hypothetical Protein SLY_0611 [Strawberry lethal yellows phytoplasma (CPA) str. NZSb11]
MKITAAEIAKAQKNKKRDLFWKDYFLSFFLPTFFSNCFFNSFSQGF